MSHSTDNRTNRDFAYYDEEFSQACSLAGVKSTPRQASKFRRGRGSAYKALHNQKKEQAKK